MPPIPELSPREFVLLTGLVRELSGIDLDGSKEYLVESRLGPLLAELDCTSYLELYRRVKEEREGRIRGRVIDAISTQETSFFRDRAPFHLLAEKLIPEHVRQIEERGARRRLAIWSAGCATGQEAYSIAMVVQECLPDPAAWQVEIVGSDISERAVGRARAGRYSRMEMDRGLSPDRVRQHCAADGEEWVMGDALRGMTYFLQGNLLEIPPHLDRFDIVFCRNVAIYFEMKARIRLFERIADHLPSHGVLIPGSTESLIGMEHRFERQMAHGAVFYRRR